MARLATVDPASAPPDAAAALRSVEQERGFVSVFHKTLAHSPGALSAYETLSRHCRLESPLEPDLREIVILRVEQHLGNEYEWRRHVPAAIRAGVSPEVIARLHAWESQEDLGPRPRAALGLVDAHLVDRSVSSATFARAAEAFSAAEIVELLLLVGMYLVGAAIIMPLDLLADDTAEPASVPMSP